MRESETVYVRKYAILEEKGGKKKEARRQVKRGWVGKSRNTNDKAEKSEEKRTQNTK